MKLDGFFKRFGSNTLAGSGNQSWFRPESAEQEITGRVFYRVFAGGEYNWSPLFSDTVFTTFADGSYSRANQTLGGWRVCAARIGVAKRVYINGFDEPEQMQALTFAGQRGYRTAAGETFFADPVALRAEKGEYICLETTVCGERIPCHPETLLPAFARTRDGWTRSTDVLFAAMLGCERPVRMRVGFLGDSITQGIGTQPNAYRHWNAVLAEKLGEDCAFWNLGLGYARASDAASGGIWLELARENDAVFLCLGVNDLYHAALSAETLKKNLLQTVRGLKRAGVSVLVQTIPPFDYEGERRQVWLQVNDWIRETLAREADAIFDNVPVLGANAQEPFLSRYGGHPDEQGCAAWAEALEPVARRFLQTVREGRARGRI